MTCALSAHELDRTAPSEVLVFPEGVDQREITAASAVWPAAWVVGAFTDHGYCRGVIVRRGHVLTSYLKVRTDGRTRGSNDLRQMPVYDGGSVCLGLLVCMDIDHVEFAAAVRERIRASAATTKVLCIPADMGSQWLNADPLPFHLYDGMYVAVCNHITTHQSRCKSFVADRTGRKMVTQRDVEPVSWDFA